jgi:hypothetical protein
VWEWHGVREVIIKDRRSNRDDRKSGPGAMLYKEPGKDDAPEEITDAPGRQHWN